jgi:DNA-binding FadR family transcriptional regulator
MAAELAQEITAGRYPGGMLPTEAELARRFATSRPTVREAVKLLKGKGLVDPRPNLGTRIRPREEWNLLDADVLAWRMATQPVMAFASQLGEVRRLIEPAAAAMAASRGKDADLAAVAEAYAGMDAAGSDRAAFSAADLRFHQAILAATGNELMVAFGALVRTALVQSIELSTRLPQAPRGGLPSHRRVLDALLGRDAAAAREAMLALLERTEVNIGLALWQPEADRQAG